MQPIHKYLSNLTPLRGITALWVVVFHFNAVIIHFVNPARTSLVSKGYMMVDLFFIMSGFIITHVYQENFKPGLSATNFRRFFVARFARIYPLHFITLLVLILMAAYPPASFGKIRSLNAIPTNLLLIHSFGIHRIFTWNVPSWSISAEWWAYMIFPALTIFLSRNKRPAIAALLLFSILSYIAIMYWFPRRDPFDPTAIVPHNLDSTFDYGFLRGLAGFIIGMLLYKLYESGLLRKLFKHDLTALFIVLVSVLCLHIGVNDEIYIILFAAIVFTFAINDGILHRICNNRVLQYLGLISYSIYMVQLFPAILFWKNKLPGVTYENHSVSAGLRTGALYCLTHMVLVVALSSITYYVIEKPLRKWINRKFGKEQMPVYA
jgi:peptidoglycan/LPS O-acetylase OafA/YrhL